MVLLLTNFVLFDDHSFLARGWNSNSSFFSPLFRFGSRVSLSGKDVTDSISCFFFILSFLNFFLFLSLQPFFPFQLHKLEHLFRGSLGYEKFLNTDFMCFFTVLLVIYDYFDFLIFFSKLVLAGLFFGYHFKLLVVLVSAAKRRVDDSQR